MGAANSVSIRIDRNRLRALVDTGAEVSVIKSSVFKTLIQRPELHSKSMNLRTANGSPLIVEGIARLRIRIGSQFIHHDFVVAKNLNRNIIPGRDWLRKKWGEDVL